MNFIDSVTGDQWLSIGALILSIIAIVVTSINIYLQYYKVELVAYAKEKSGNLFIIIENNSSNMAKEYSIKLLKIHAPSGIESRLKKMPLLNGKARFNLSPKDTLNIYIDTLTANLTTTDGKFPEFELVFYDSKNKKRGSYTVDFHLLLNNAMTYDEHHLLQKELRKGFESIESALKKK